MAFNSIASAETCRKSAPFRAGYSPLSQALSTPLQGSVRFLRLSSTPSVIPLPCGQDTASRRDEWGLPCCPMRRCGWGGCALWSGGSRCHRRRRFQSTNRPACHFGAGLSAPLAGSGSRTLTMGVHLRSALHPLLGRIRIGASRVRPLSPELHTLDCSVACPGSSTWVNKVPSRDTPTLNLTAHRSGVILSVPQVAQNPPWLRPSAARAWASSCVAPSRRAPPAC
jgi:hypothetical protein